MEIEVEVRFYPHWRALTQKLSYRQSNQIWDAIFKWQATGEDTTFSEKYLQDMYDRFKYDIETLSAPDPTYEQLSDTERQKLEYFITLINDTPGEIDEIARRTNIPLAELPQKIHDILHAHPPRCMATLLYEPFFDHLIAILRYAQQHSTP